MKVCLRPLAAGCLAILCGSQVYAQSPSPTPATADGLWAEIEQLTQGPQSQSATPQDVMDLMKKLVAATTDFQKRFPKDPRRWEAKLMELQYETELGSANSQQPDRDKIEAVLKSVAAAPDAPKEAKAEARINLIGLHASASDADTPPPALEAEMVAFLHDYPDDPNDADLQKMRLNALQKSDPKKAEQMLAALLTDPNLAVAQMAQSEAAMLNLKNKPLDLKFTAEDGTKVDLSKMRGKVVVIDFWATWCVPCMEELPALVKTYNDFHPKGLEIVGISLDQDKGPMEAVAKTSGAVWPQYFDGKGWQNDISSRYGITEIPRMWLVNKKGMVVDTEPGDGLNDEITKLLAE